MKIKHLLPEGIKTSGYEYQQSRNALLKQLGLKRITRDVPIDAIAELDAFIEARVLEFQVKR